MKDVHLFPLRKEFWKLKKLIKEGVDVNDCSTEDNPIEYSPLIFASISGSKECIILLIINGANVNYQVKNQFENILFHFK